MSKSNYDNWSWDSQMEDYNPQEIKYCGEDMYEAYRTGSHYFERNDFEIKRLREDNEALKELIKANKRVEENSQPI